MTDDTAHVLVVDDNEMNRDMLSRRLQRMKYTADVAENGEQALEMVAQKDYQLVLLDIMMPTLSGYEVLERIKNDEATRHLPVIMISAVDDLDSVVRCIEMGAEDYLFKPFNPVLLKARIHASLARSGSAGSLIQDAQPHLTAMKAEVAALLADNSGTLDAAHTEHLQRVQQHLAALDNLLT